MSIIVLISFNLFVSSSVPQGSTAYDTPSGFSVMIGGKYMLNYDFIASYYSQANYEIRLHGMVIGKELFIGKNFSILPETGVVKGRRLREGASETGFSPLLLIRFAYIFSVESSTFQIGFSFREAFNGKVGVDFIDFGIGFRM